MVRGWRWANPVKSSAGACVNLGAVGAPSEAVAGETLAGQRARREGASHEQRSAHV
jgi:hypothetical protein